MTEAIMTRGLITDIKVRDIDEDERTATFVAATENGVRTWSGTEYLSVKGVDLTRYKKNPVLLDTHRRDRALDVIGNTPSIKKQGSELVITSKFAEHDNADDIWNLVKDDFIRGVSVGYIPREIKEIKEDAKGKLSGREIEGPARIITKWELIEISVVPVPADADALKRGILDESLDIGTAQSLIEILTGIVKEKKMTLKKREQGDPEINGGDDEEEEIEETEDNTSGNEGNTEGGGNEAPAKPAEKESEQKQQIYDITPRGFEHIAREAVINGWSLEETRTRLLKEHAKIAKPVGTPEPEDPEKEKGKEQVKVEEIDDDTFARSLTG